MIPGLFQSTLPVGGRDEAFWMIIFVASRFQSTLPVGGRDAGTCQARDGKDDFNPPSPWGGGTWGQLQVLFEDDISIHPPRGGEGR